MNKRIIKAKSNIIRIIISDDILANKFEYIKEYLKIKSWLSQMD